jgi:drug/metabolite transporter (DMT)-like permease
MTKSAVVHSARTDLGIVAPGLFVLLWSSAFVGAKLGLAYAEPLTFLGLRFALAAVFMAALASLASAPWPSGSRALVHAVVAGLLIHAVYLGGVYVAISRGLPAGVASLIVSLQPLLTAALSGLLLDERVVARQWLGLGLGIAGTGLVLEQKLGVGGDGWSLVSAIVALLAITLGTMHQKRFGAGMDLRTGAAVQYAASALVVLVLAGGTETMQIRWTPTFIAVFAYVTFAISFGAIMLYYVLIRRGEAARVASVMYLVPPVTALLAWPMFGETLGPFALAGMALAAVGVALASR